MTLVIESSKDDRIEYKTKEKDGSWEFHILEIRKEEKSQPRWEYDSKDVLKVGWYKHYSRESWDTNYVDSGWDEIALGILRRCNLIKYSLN